MSSWKAKRFWKSACVVETPAGFGIELDARPVKTPAKRLLETPTRALAEAIALEWDAQEGQIDPLSMPFTRTANAALDKVAVQHGEVADMLAAYGDSDLLCYRAETPEELVARQSARWDPMLDWAASALEARLAVHSGVVHVAQDPAVLARLSARVHALSTFELTAFHDLVSLSGSLILAFAATRGVLDAAAIWEVSRLDEIWQAEQWGADDIAEAAAEVKQAAFVHAYSVFSMCQPVSSGHI